MVKPLHFLLARKKGCPSLSELDEIYKIAISQLPVSTRIDYCERQIGRIQYELKHNRLQAEIVKLKQLAKAIEKEIYSMNPTSSKQKISSKSFDRKSHF